MLELDYIISQVNRRFGFDYEELFASRSKRAVRARRVVYLTLRHLDWSLYEIGKAFGKDHSTILTALKNVKPVDKTFSKQILRFVNEEIRRYGLDD